MIARLSRHVAGASILAMACAIAMGCGGGRRGDANEALDAKFPPRPEGCNIQLFHGDPNVPTVNLGPVTARCSEDINEADCIRTLKDQACKLGGDVVWGVDEPMQQYDKRVYSGRAAHTKPKEQEDAGWLPPSD